MVAERYSIGYQGQGRLQEQLHEILQSQAIDTTLSTQDKALLGFDADDMGNAEAVEYLYKGELLHNTAYGWLWWNGTHWEHNPSEVTRAIAETFKRRRKAAVAVDNEKIIRCTKRDAFRIEACARLLQSRVDADISTFDADPDLLNCLNGAVNLKTGELLSHDPDQRFTYCLPVAYNPAAAMDTWSTFLENVIGGGQEVIDYLQMDVGYSLTGHTSEECLFYLYGPTRSGKGTFTETLLALVPKPLAVEVDFNTFTARRDGNDQNFDLAPLKPSRLVFASESNKYQSLNPGKIKALTGGNYVQCAFKHRDMFSYKPQYTVWLSSNHPVNGDADDDALWGRVHVISFPNSYLGREDRGLKARMRETEVLEGVLRWAVEGAIKWYASGGLVTPRAVRESTQEHRDQLDTVRMWLDERCEKVADKWTPNAEIMRSYVLWCQENNQEPKSARSLMASLKQRGFETNVVARAKVGGKSIPAKGVGGLVILPNVQVALELYERDDE